MSDEEFLITLREAFIVEAQEHLQAMTSGLLDLEQHPQGARRQELVEITFREAHSLKGASRAVSRMDIEALCQEMETIFAEWKEHEPKVSAAQFDALNRCVNLVSTLIDLPATTEDPSVLRSIEELVRELRGEAVESKVAAPQEMDAAPSSEGAPKKARKPRRKVSPTPKAIHLPPAMPAAPASAEVEKTQTTETIRVSMAKMDSLLLHAEEMISVKLTAGQHAAELRELGDSFAMWHTRWAKVRDANRQSGTQTNATKALELREFMEWNQGFMSTLEKRISTLARTARQDERTIGALVDELLDGAKDLVMLPCATLLDIFPKQVRDLARDEGKEVELVMHGREVELDKRILEEMKAPLIHLVRNAIDHGMDTPAERAKAVKPGRGTLTISVSQAEGNKALIVVSDDGRGIRADKLRASAVKHGTISAEDATRMSDEAALSLIFQSGVSTSPIVTEVSGRGLGMAIVREKVTKLGGTILVESKPGKGTTFRILLPVTLATFKGVLVQAGGQTFVIPVSSAERIKRFHCDDIRTMEGRETVELDGRAVAFTQLADALELPKRPSAATQQYIECVVLGAGDDRVAFGVDAVLNEQEVLVKNLGRPLLRVRNIAAATVLGSGTPVLILNAADLLKSAVRAASTSRHVSVKAADPEAKVSRILVADDSVTSRMLIKNILESSGYSVETATDGMEALATLRNRQFDLLVSDVEMPRMNGFELTSSVRSDQKYHELPVVLVTALSSREDRERGIDAGANAYIVKSSFDQSDLLSVVGNLI